MKSVPAYEREPYRTSLEVEVVGRGEADGRPFALLDDTILYPEGGGQPADHGRLGGVDVVDVQRRDGEVRHYLAAPAALGPALLELDWARRFDHMQQHTAQHLLTAVAADRFGWATTSFHLGAELSDVELDTAPPAASRLEALEAEVMGEVRAARPVRARRVARETYAGMAVRSRGLPAGHLGDVRLVEIAGLDLNTCGGTHLASTAEIEAVKLLGAEGLRGGTRLLWVAGGRVRRRLARADARLAELRRVLETGDDELAAAAAAKLGELRETARRLRALEERHADALAEALAARPEGVVESHLDGADGGLLQRFAGRYAALAGEQVALLTASGPRGDLFALAAGEACRLDVQAAGRQVAELLAGRGGGAGRLFQGKAGSLVRRPEALALLAGLLTSP